MWRGEVKCLSLTKPHWVSRQKLEIKVCWSLPTWGYVHLRLELIISPVGGLGDPPAVTDQRQPHRGGDVGGDVLPATPAAGDDVETVPSKLQCSVTANCQSNVAFLSGLKQKQSNRETVNWSSPMAEILTRAVCAVQFLIADNRSSTRFNWFVFVINLSSHWTMEVMMFASILTFPTYKQWLHHS